MGVFLAVAGASCNRTPTPPPETPSATAEAAQPKIELAVSYADLGYAGGLFTYANQPFTGTTEENYPNDGPLKSRYGFKNGVYHGVVEEWYENGNKKTQTHYVDGLHEGENRYWNRDGSPQSKKIWKADVLISEEHYGTK
jgi:antitoxin component YwqK of YwqJK toxin-antitoxin module